jgi:CBS domain-containing protein
MLSRPVATTLGTIVFRTRKETAMTKPSPLSNSSLADTYVEDVMSHGVLSCALETPLSAVAEMMAKHRVHCIVGFGDVTEDDTRLWGLISDLDLVAVAAAEDLDGRTAGGSAATEVVTVGPHESLRRAAQLMSEHGVAHLLVADPDSDKPLGVISTLDVVAALAGVIEPRRESGATRVEQLMTTRVVTASPEMPLKQVAALLAEHRVSGVPVVEDGEVVGVVSEGDILAKEQGPTAAPVHGMLGWILGNGEEDVRAKLEARTAGDAMSTPAVTIEPWRSASAAASLMLERSVKRLPVLKEGKLVGIVSRGDLVRAFARPDTEIEDDIRREVILHLLWMSPDDIDVEVRGGMVKLRGEVETRLLAELLPEEIQRVPGVVRVHSELTVAPTTAPH